MGRVGFTPENASDAAEIISKLPNLEIEGIFTHFAVADEYSEKSNAYTREQYAKFYEVCEKIRQEKHINIPIRHAANSAAIPETDESIKHLKKCLLLIIIMSIIISERIMIPKTVLLFTFKFNTTLFKI